MEFIHDSCGLVKASVFLGDYYLMYKLYLHIELSLGVESGETLQNKFTAVPMGLVLSYNSWIWVSSKSL